MNDFTVQTKVSSVLILHTISQLRTLWHDPMTIVTPLRVRKTARNIKKPLYNIVKTIFHHFCVVQNGIFTFPHIRVPTTLENTTVLLHKFIRSKNSRDMTIYEE